MISKIKKPVSILLSLIMVFSMFAIVPFTAGATEKTIAEGVIYKLGDTIVLPGEGIYYVNDGWHSTTVSGNGTITLFEGDEYSYTLKIKDWNTYTMLDTFDYWEEMQQGLSVLGITFTGSGTQSDPYLLKLALGVFESTWAGEGEGTEDSPWLINDVEDLRTLSANVKSGMKYTGKYLKLMADIDCGSGNWEPIGQGATFGGTFDGNGNTIIYHITNSTVEANGLFSEIAATGTVKNLSVSGSIFSSGDFNGGIAGKNGGLIINCLSTVDITTSNTDSGGIAGSNWLEASKTRYCVSTGTLTWTGASNAYAYIGGITGENRWGAIDHCAMLGDVLAQNTTDSWAYAGILIGREMGSTTDCYYLNTAETAGVVNSGSATPKTADELKAIGQAAYDAGYTVYGLALGAVAPATYTVTWKNGDTVLETDTGVAEGATPTYDGTTPEKAEDENYTYTFSGWTDGSNTYAADALPAVSGDVTYTAVYNSTVNEYTVTWKNDDGSVIDTTTVAYGEVPTLDDPTKDADAQYTYTFAGWSDGSNTYAADALPAVSGDVTYTAVYNSTVNEYTVTWKNDDGSVIDTTTVAYGEVPTHADPTKDADDIASYKFIGWDKEIVPVTGDAEYTAVFDYDVITAEHGPQDDGTFYLLGEKQKAYKLIEFEGEYYLVAEYNKIAKNQTRYLNASMVEGTDFAVGYYWFDEEGHMQTLRNGPMADGCFYKDNERLTAYQLVSYDNGWYFIAENHKYVKSVRRYLNASMVEGTGFAAGYYEFDADGKMIYKQGPDADGYFYLNNEKQKAYKLINFDNSYYLVAEYHKYAKSQRRYLNASMVEGTDFAVGFYDFDADGRMILAD